MNKSKKLNLTELKKLEKKINKRKKVYVGEEKYEIMIDEFIKDTDIDEIVMELNELIDDLRKKEKVTNTDIKNICSLHPLLMIRKFTDASVPEGNDIEKLINVSNLYINTGLTFEILSHFSDEQVKKMNDRSTELMKETGKKLGEIALQQEIKKNPNLNIGRSMINNG